MLFLHSCPVDKAISIVYKEHHEADDDRKVRNILDCGKCPKNYKHDIVNGIGKREIGTSSCRKADGNKACRYRKRARQKVCGAEFLKNEIESNRYNDGKRKNNGNFLFVNVVNGNLALFALIGVS